MMFSDDHNNAAIDVFSRELTDSARAMQDPRVHDDILRYLGSFAFRGYRIRRRCREKIRRV